MWKFFADYFAQKRDPIYRIPVLTLKWLILFPVEGKSLVEPVR